MILNELKAKGIDSYSVGGDFGKELLVLFAKRNVVTHPPGETDSAQEQAAKQQAAEWVRMWVLRNLVKCIDTLGLKGKYFSSH